MPDCSNVELQGYSEAGGESRGRGRLQQAIQQPPHTGRDAADVAQYVKQPHSTRGSRLSLPGGQNTTCCLHANFFICNLRNIAGGCSHAAARPRATKGRGGPQWALTGVGAGCGEPGWAGLGRMPARRPPPSPTRSSALAGLPLCPAVRSPEGATFLQDF